MTPNSDGPYRKRSGNASPSITISAYSNHNQTQKSGGYRIRSQSKKYASPKEKDMRDVTWIDMKDQFENDEQN